MSAILQGVRAGMQQVAVPQGVGVKAPPAPVAPPSAPQWLTPLDGCQPPAECSHWCFACFCTPCASAKAKSMQDDSSVLTNLCCWDVIANYGWIRRQYGIQGSAMHDICWAFCCPCIATRRAFTETRVRGLVPLPRAPGYQKDDWKTEKCRCGCCDSTWYACMCPCLVADDIRKKLLPDETKGRNESFVDACCLTPIPCAMYSQVRHHYGLMADFEIAEDICIPCVCYPCALSQALREVRERSPSYRQHMLTAVAQWMIGQQQQHPQQYPPGRV